MFAAIIKRAWKYIYTHTTHPYDSNASIVPRFQFNRDNFILFYLYIEIFMILIFFYLPDDVYTVHYTHHHNNVHIITV